MIACVHYRMMYVLVIAMKGQIFVLLIVMAFWTLYSFRVILFKKTQERHIILLFVLGIVAEKVWQSAYFKANIGIHIKYDTNKDQYYEIFCLFH